DARERAGGCADLGGEVWQGAEVVARERSRLGELGAGELDAIAGVAAETDRYTFDLLSGLPHNWITHRFAHPPLRRLETECIGRCIGRNPTEPRGLRSRGRQKATDASDFPRRLRAD